jgi:hypothetical protein
MLKRAILTSLLILSAAPTFAQTQTQPCTVTQHDDPICDQVAFQKTFSAARSVTFNQDKLDRYAAKQLQETLTSLGKQVVPVGDRSQLGFELTQPSTDGIFVGPSGIVLARLQVFGPGPRRPLLWEETYRDQPDVPWQSAVLYLLRQFHDRFAPTK